WVVGAIVFAATVGIIAWLVTSRRAPPGPVAEPVAAASAVTAPPAPAPAVETHEAPPSEPPAAAAVPQEAPRPPATVPTLAGSPQQDAPSSEEPDEADYRAAVQAAREANAASRWVQEAEQYRRALAVRPASLEAKEGLGSAIVKSSGRAGSYLEAERLLAEVVTVDEGRPRAWLVLGMARQLGARPGPAVEAYRRFLALVPQGPESADVRAVVRELGRDVAQRRSGR
ncbi:MAG TPA: hypothetical protein VFN91_17135, partial [Myxococcaceae bacterium]|nr:hypothetical protein [Myxococcaceae bacterium]